MNDDGNVVRGCLTAFLLCSPVWAGLALLFWIGTR